MPHTSHASAHGADTHAAHRRYILRTFAFMGGYVALMMLVITGAIEITDTPFAWVFALAVAAPVAGQIWATLMLMRDSDEFVRAVTAKRFILAAGGAIALFSAWGFLETFATVQHAPGWLIYPLFWALYAVATPLVRSS